MLFNANGEAKQTESGEVGAVDAGKTDYPERPVLPVINHHEFGCK